MNENERSLQDFPGSQPVDVNIDGVGAQQNVQNIVPPSTINSDVQSSEVQPAFNFMDNFVDAVVQKPDPIQSVQREIPVISSQTDQLLEESLRPNDVQENETSAQLTQAPTDVSAVQQQAIESIPEIDDQQQDSKVVSSDEKQSHWKFILILFAVVGVAVLLFPIAVRIFGY